MARRSITQMRKSKHRFKITVNKAEESIAVIKNIHQGDKTLQLKHGVIEERIFPRTAWRWAIRRATSTPTNIQWEYEAPCTRGVKSLMLLMV